MGCYIIIFKKNRLWLELARNSYVLELFNKKVDEFKINSMILYIYIYFIQRGDSEIIIFIT